MSAPEPIVGEKPPENPADRKRALAKSALRFLVSASLLAFLAWVIDWRATLETLTNANFFWAAAAGALSLVDRVILNFKWQALLTGLQVRVDWWPLLRVQFAANFVGMLFPSSIGVDAFRSLALIRQGHRKSSVIAATLIDRLTIVAATLLVGVTMLTLNSELALPAWLAYLTYGGFAALVLGSLALCSKRVRGWTGTMAGRLLRASWVPVLRESWHRGVDGIIQTPVIRSTLLALAGAIAIRIFIGQAFAFACGYEVSFWQMLIAYPIVWIAVMLPITVGGLGLQEAAFVVAMGIIGIPPEAAIAMSVLEHLVLRAAVLPGLFFLRSLGPEMRSAYRKSTRAS